VSPGDERLVLVGRVLAPAETWEGGAIRVEGGLITCVGCDCLVEGATVITCPEAVLSPGLINPHDHLSYTEGHPIDHGLTRYDHRHDWRGSLSTPTNPHGGSSATGAGNRWGELRQALAGTTSLVGSGRALGLLRNLEYGDALEGLPFSPVDNETFPLGDSGEWFEDDCGWDYTRDDWDVAQAGVAFVPHVSEGIDDYAAEEFFCLSRQTDGGEDFIERHAAPIHGIGLRAGDWWEMAREGAALIWSPRSNLSLYGMTAEVTLFARLGGVIALGTDWTYSGSVHSGRELACAVEFNDRNLGGFFTDAELWRMTTEHAAQALGARALIGALEVGQVADVAVFHDPRRVLHRAVAEAGAADVPLVLRGGVPLVGEVEAVQALGRTCEVVDVCGAPRAVCAEAEFGQSYAALAAEVAGSYPAFFCGTPTGEPTCEPFRPGAFDGLPTPLDADGDGLPDAEDLCPTVFDPPRPMDGGRPRDSDGDGIGDACDEDPLAPDLDGDGVPNGVDVCPHVADAQRDSDGDGRGDACEVCPELPNPDAICPPPPASLVTVYDLQADRVAWGSPVRLEGVVVTGVGEEGFTVQDPAGGERSGIYVYTGATPEVALHHRLSLEGSSGDYFGETQVVLSAVLLDEGPVSPLLPQDLTVAAATDEAWEGVLVRLVDGEVTDPAYDCAVDGACEDPGLWEVGGPTGALLFDRLYQDLDWTDRIGQLPVSGVLGYRWERRRLMPRTGADFE
jgi:cytosine/adenosine deaminase-related metal-dependent hydrolase